MLSFLSSVSSETPSYCQRRYSQRLSGSKRVSQREKSTVWACPSPVLIYQTLPSSPPPQPPTWHLPLSEALAFTFGYQGPALYCIWEFVVLLWCRWRYKKYQSVRRSNHFFCNEPHSPEGLWRNNVEFLHLLGFLSALLFLLKLLHNHCFYSSISFSVVLIS